MNRRIFVPSILIASLLFALVGFAGPASAQYAATCTYDSLSSPNTVSGEGAQPGTTVVVELTNQFLLDGTLQSPQPEAVFNGQVGTATADADGLWTAAVTIPTELPNGDYFLFASGDSYSESYLDDDPKAELSIACTAFELDVEGELAFTGAESATLAKYGLSILAAGGLVLFAANRRKEAVND